MFFPINKLEYICLQPDESLTNIVESIWMVKNHSEEEKEGIIVPDGKIDLFLLADENGNFEIFVAGICSVPISKPPFPKSTMFAISFYPIAAEYIFKQSFADLNNTKKILPTDYWGFSRDDLIDFNQFYYKTIEIISLLLSKEIENRKKKLFKLIYDSKGEITVKELEENTFWSSRQMNRYFHKWFGVTLKTYLNIIRFSNSLKQLKNGDFYPQLNYADQSHFIREVKKFAGVKPIILNKNENDRFIQFSLMPEK
ncbi:AraC family transcriptional regulator [uncultured Chryseobacterium sp.]|uniref:helix-turn-helix domain-containing protein n=1 Tax=Chryseobacterium sp. sg2396 TaxID=3276280 RepID=UPI0025895611|nr:AraC family transcriptional regulator [uncultured Chryseobacterium sp.]